jgi:hypothetical protein
MYPSQSGLGRWKLPQFSAMPLSISKHPLSEAEWKEKYARKDETPSKYTLGYFLL